MSGYYYQPDGCKDPVQPAGDDQCYSSGLFRELQLPSGNTRVHLLRINPLGAEDKDTRTPSPQEHKYSSKDFRSNSGSSAGSSKRSVSAVEKKSKKKSHKFEMPKQDLMMPCDSISTASSDASLGFAAKKAKGGIMMLDGSEGDLETEHVSFHEQVPVFSNSVDVKYKTDHEAEMSNLMEQFPAFKTKLGFKHLIGPTSKSTRPTSPGSGAHGTWNGEVEVPPTSSRSCQSSKKEKEKGKKRRSGRASGHEEGGLDLQAHVVSLETQIYDQVNLMFIGTLLTETCGRDLMYNSVTS